MASSVRSQSSECFVSQRNVGEREGRGAGRKTAGNKKGRTYSPFSVMKKKEKMWFFLLFSEQPKINELIFRVFYWVTSSRFVRT
ncbi:hypothetical protein [Mangrovibacter sp. MFB070]|uniref:hypothetical protein n=1 Tax=Mangrovibacter sp. MFB070 TaxID=1224318 RepID=UPI001268E41F|nr:hypothetical protein [Mangrovibacter sp. MFB070]